MYDLSVPWVLLRVRDQLFGVPASHVREMAEMPGITRVPNMPEFVTGLVSLRGQITPTIDLRRRLGIPTAEEDLKGLVDALGAAEAEHRRLADQLETSIAAGRTAEVDSGACAFHQWLGRLQTKNPLVRLHLKKLEVPHEQLHAAVARVAATAGADPVQAAAELRHLREKELAAFTRILPQVRERLVHAHRQIVVVFTLDGQALGASVDEVESIERLKDRSIEELPQHLQGMHGGLTRLVGRRTRDDEIVLILEVESLFRINSGEPVHGAWMDQTGDGPRGADASPMTSAADAARMSSSPGEVVPDPAAEPVPGITAAPVSVASVVDTAARSATRRAPETPVADSVPEVGSGFAHGREERAWCGNRIGF
jgi:chemotaxis signal transduction protein